MINIDITGFYAVDMETEQESNFRIRILDQDKDEIDVMEIDYTRALNHLSLSPNTYSFSIPPRAASTFCNLLQSNLYYKQSVVRYWTCSCNSNMLIIHLNNTSTVYMDYIGANIAKTVIMEMIELEDALHWLSTLGGAFSNLGEHDPQFAVKAGTNAMKQLLVAMRSGDKTVMVKCWLFMGQSLLQQGQFNEAAKILRSVWSICHLPPLSLLTSTSKLLNMCRGIWARLKHEREKVKSKSMEKNLEVEQKFCVPDNYRTVLQSAGAKKVGEKILSDVYLDTKDLVLLRQLVWLRMRGSQFELKIPIGGDKTSGMTHKEVEGKEEVGREVAKLTTVDLDAMVELVKVVSVRESWSFGEFSIVIDRLTDDDWTVGEVELVVEDKDEVERAKKKVYDMATKLGFTVQRSGKVEHCLSVQNVTAAEILKKVKMTRRKNTDEDVEDKFEMKEQCS